MIDENFEAQQYLKGEGITRDNLYRICYLLAIHYKTQGFTKVETRNAIFRWGKKFNIWIKYDVNSIIDRAFDLMNPSFKTPTVKINKQDVAKINELFDNLKTKKVALALLCYAKGHADKSGYFYISSVALGAWLKINRKTLRSKYIKELIDYEYIMEIERPGNSKQWNCDFDKQATKYRVNASIHNSGEYVLRNNEIDKLFREVFLDAI